MGLNFGWKPSDVRESIWQGDDSLANVPEAALVSWRVDGDASHLKPYATNGAPSKITFRTLTADELMMVQTRYFGAERVESYTRMVLLCFRIAVDFPDAPTETTDARGVKVTRVAKESGVVMMTDGFIRHIEESYPGIGFFYGNLVLQASMPTAAEKKASSQPSTPPPSEPASGAQAPGVAA